MSEPAQPLSRRERRALEEAARAAEGDVTQALPVTPETGSSLSRRERRRLERLASPPETWTREEELIATGQMPAMTAEVLAEQDRLAAERAEAEARAAEAYAATAPVTEVMEPVEAVEALPEEAVADAAAPEEAADDEAAVAEVEAPPAAPAANEIPTDLRHLFPPGSLQARAFAAQQEQPVAAAPGPGNEAVDEIRRLTQEAMAGITRATTDAVPVVDGDAATADEPAEQATTDFLAEPAQAPEAPLTTAQTPVFAPVAASDGVPELPELPDGLDVEALWNAPTVDEPVREPALAPAFADVDPEPINLADVPLVGEMPVPAQVDGAHAPSAPVWSALVPTQPVAAETPTFAQVTTAEQAPPAPSVWDTHPLTNPGASPVRELPAEPAQQDLPRPDLSALLEAPATSVGQAPYASTEPATSPGALPQRPAEPRAGGGARHFRWAHLAVIGAIAFVLGVVVWNVAKG